LPLQNMKITSLPTMLFSSLFLFRPAGPRAI
jgi:hypothetical protein